MIEPKFPYQNLERTTLESGFRTYTCPVTENELASVTTILGLTGDHEWLENWKKWKGEKEANRISSEAAALGSLIHEHMEDHFQGKELDDGGSNIIHVMAGKMAKVLIENGFNHIDEVWGIEAPLYFPGLYAGTADLICIYKGLPTIGDFKTTIKPKPRSYVEDYMHQLGAYGLAHNELFGTKIQQAVILMVSRDGEFQEFLIKGQEFEDYCETI